MCPNGDERFINYYNLVNNQWIPIPQASILPAAPIVPPIPQAPILPPIPQAPAAPAAPAVEQNGLDLTNLDDIQDFINQNRLLNPQVRLIGENGINLRNLNEIQTFINNARYFNLNPRVRLIQENRYDDEIRRRNEDSSRR